MPQQTTCTNTAVLNYPGLGTVGLISSCGSAGGGGGGTGGGGCNNPPAPAQGSGGSAFGACSSATGSAPNSPGSYTPLPTDGNVLCANTANLAPNWWI